MKVLSIRLEDDVALELENLSKLLNTSKNKLVNMVIRQEYNKYYDEPKIKKAIEQMNELKGVLERFQNELQ